VSAHSDFELPFPKICPVVLSDTVILPSVTYPVRIESPASLRALEEALKSDGIIFLAGDVSTLKEDSAPSGRSTVGTLCRVWRKPVHSFGGGDLIAEGLERACARQLIEAEGFLSAEIFYDPFPDQAPDEEQLKALDKEVRRLLGELHQLLPEGDPDSKVNSLFNVQDIISPSRLADRTAFLLYLRGLASTRQLRTVLETFPPDRRLRMLSWRLTEAIETEQLQALLLKRLYRRYPVQPLLPPNFLGLDELGYQQYMDEYEGKHVDATRRYSPDITAFTPRRYVSVHLLRVVDEVIELLFTEGRTKAELDRHAARGASFDPSLYRREATRVSNKLGRRYGESARHRLGVQSDGRTKKWGRSELSQAIDSAMIAVINLPNGEGIDYDNVANMIHKLYPGKDRLTGVGLKNQASRLKIGWMEKKAHAQNMKLFEDLRHEWQSERED
jgi:hypothetical protein